VIGGVLFLHFCSQCGHEIPHREKFCQSCGTRIEYLCALPPLPPESVKRREVHTAASITKWIILYVFAIVSTFGLSYLYFSSPDSFTWNGRLPNQARLLHKRWRPNIVSLLHEQKCQQ